MISLEIIQGSLFHSNCQTLVNTVNCQGVMGAGIAKEFKKRYPEMFTSYKRICDRKLLTPGKLWIYKDVFINILCFPTKDKWRNKSEESYLETGLQRFRDTYKEKGITSIAWPLLGASNGGIAPERSLEIMTRYLSGLDIPVEIYIYRPSRDKKDEKK